MFGVSILVAGPVPALVLTGLLFALASLSYQMLLAHRYWMHSLLQQDTEAE